MSAYRDVFRTWSNIYNGLFLAEIINFFKLLTIFAKKAPLQMFDLVKNRLQARVWNIELSCCEQINSCLQIKPRKYSPGKYMWHYFWKDERCLCRSSHPKGSLRKVLWEISQNSQKKSVSEYLFFDKVKLFRPTASLKTRL